MADNRNFVNKFANQGGGDIFVEDAKLSEISTKTAIVSEGVMLKGTDGAYYEIDKASLSEVIRAELGAILADNSKNNGTSVAKVPTLNSSGNALGASSVADLASVLGGVTKSATGSINDLKTPGMYYSNSLTDLPNMPSTSGSTWYRVIVQGNNTNIISQYLIRNDGSYVLFRQLKSDGTTWNNWSNTNSFGCNTAADLASLLGGQLKRELNVFMKMTANGTPQTHTIPGKPICLLFGAKVSTSDNLTAENTPKTDLIVPTSSALSEYWCGISGNTITFNFPGYAGSNYGAAKFDVLYI